MTETKNSIVDFWISLFNTGNELEKKNFDDVEKILSDISDLNFNECIEKYTNEKDYDYKVNYDDNELIIDCFEKIKNNKQYRWVYFYYDIIANYYNEIQKILDYGKEIIFDRKVMLNVIIAHMIDSMNEISYRPLIVEINYLKSEGKLIGDTPEERAAYFSDVLLKDRDYVESVMHNYPEMIRLFEKKMQYNLEFFKKIIKDTADNIENIEENVNNSEKLGKLVSIMTGSGDTHNGGKSVAKLIFENKKIIVYKPHALETDKAYNRVMEEVSDFSESLGYGRFYLPKLYTAGDSGWVEFIRNEFEPKNEEEIKNYHKKLGILSCVLYTLSASDMHSENIIALHNSPVIIDLETITQPKYAFEDKSDIEEKVLDKIVNSVKGTVIFPTHIYNPKTGKTIELGGVGNVKEQDSAFESNFIASIDTDNVKLEKRTGKIALHSNVLVKDNKRINAADYFKELCIGFEQMYRYILANKEHYTQLLCESFKNTVVRVLYRSTYIYASMLDLSYHPTLLGNSIDRFIYLHRLALNNGDSTVIKTEIESMKNGDIPLLQISSENRGSEIAGKDIYALSPIENMRQKIASMDEADLRRQRMVMKGCFSIISDNSTNFKYNSEVETKEKNAIDNNTISELCTRLFDNAITGTYNDKKCHTWLGCIENENNIIDCKDISDSVYYGRAGIAFALYCAYLYTGNQEYLEKADSTFELTFSSLDAIDLSSFDTGMYDGIAGVLFLLVFCRTRLGRTEYDKYINKILDSIIDRLDETPKIDKLGGLTGIADAAMYVYDATNDKEIKSKAKNLLKTVVVKLCNKVNIKNGIAYWEEQNYTGFAHGSAGIISTLTSCSKYVEIPDLENIINATLNSHDIAYSDDEKNWSRNADEIKVYNYGWCHGAPGILLSRINMYNNGWHSERIMNDINNAISTIKEKCFGKNYCLCHGDIGNLLILRYAAEVLDDKELIAETEYNFKNLINKYIIPMSRENKLLTGYDENGLFCGISGIIYSICKFECYNCIPNILNLGSE